MQRSSKIMKPKVYYIAGPMSGYPEFNFPAFYKAAEMFQRHGYRTYNPANKELENHVAVDNNMEDGDRDGLMADGFDFRATFTWDCIHVIKANGIYMLSGWEKSHGARAEHAVAVAMQACYPEYQIMYEEG